MTGLEVIGAGFGRTGTQSMQAALELLGFAPCYHMDELNRRPEQLDTWVAALAGEPVDWQTFFADYRAAVDWPTCTFWRELLDAFPDARVVLTERDVDAWYDSVARTIAPLTEAGLATAAGERHRQLRFGNELIFERTFGGRFAEREHARQVYADHVAAVKDAVSAPRLLVHEVGDGWDPLGAVLGRPVPDVAYPHSNRTGEWRRRIAGS